MMEDNQSRTAYKTWIRNLQDSSKSIMVNGKQIYKVNLIAPIISKTESEDNNYISITLDDGTGQIKIKTWNQDIQHLQNFNVGDTIMVIGQLKEYNQEVYLTPELTKKKEPIWEYIQKLEILKEQGKPEIIKVKQIQPMTINTPNATTQSVTEETIVDTNIDNNRGKILKILENLDSSDGVDIETISKECNIGLNELSQPIQELVSEGQIFQLQKNKFKIM